ncbi:Glyco-hydro-cc domain-containing protein [Mycena chlorophos]|uniref:Glyco-hydro-cc domain-containing protein n=1 Tax=Mycena chlorophos TaxID=658473 RepID=A0A8H6WGX2_MYCCL|nr:Glyco-hydro-cc domain-containing protein [Mycena chlorophos]
MLLSAPFKTLLASVALLAALVPSVSGTARGLAWATDNDYAPNIGDKPMISWYYHWEDGIVPQMPSDLEFVPQFWGNTKWSQWNSVKSEMNSHWPKHILGFNEPDISSQANMSPEYAAQVWMQELHPYGTKGVKLVSPAVAYNLDWTDSFISAVAKSGGWVDMVGVHWYGSWQDLAGFKKYVSTARSRFNRKIWVTEIGITTASAPSQAQVKTFMMDAFSWMQSTGYVDRASWFGCFEATSPPDNYATGKNALLKTPGQPSDMGMWYSYTTNPDRRSGVPAEDRRARHHAIAARVADEDWVEWEGEPIHCDAICELRNEMLAPYSDEEAPHVTEDTEGDEL